MKKKLLLMMSVLLAIGLFSACNKSDDVTDINNHSEKEEAGAITILSIKINIAYRKK